MSVNYELLRKRIVKRCNILSVISIQGIPKERFDEIKRDARGISTLELTYIARGLHTTVHGLMGINSP